MTKIEQWYQELFYYVYLSLILFSFPIFSQENVQKTVYCLEWGIALKLSSRSNSYLHLWRYTRWKVNSLTAVNCVRRKSTKVNLLCEKLITSLFCWYPKIVTYFENDPCFFTYWENKTKSWNIKVCFSKFIVGKSPSGNSSADGSMHVIPLVFYVFYSWLCCFSRLEEKRLKMPIIQKLI